MRREIDPMTAQEAADSLRAAAANPTPPKPRPFTLLDWIGATVFERVYMYCVLYMSSDADEFFFKLSDDDQRTFLPILAELIEV